MATLENIGKESKSLQVLLHSRYLSFRGSYCSLSALILKVPLFSWGNRDLTGLLNASVTGLGNPVPIGINLIYDKVRLMSFLLLSNIV